MVSRKAEGFGSVYTESNYSSDEEDGYDENDSDYSPANKMAKISTNNYYPGGKGKTLSPFCLDKQFQHGGNNNSVSRMGPRPKCSSRNALMARENRIKKKLYMENLEAKLKKYGNENKQLNGLVENQSSLIADLRKEVKYLKSVLANSGDITRLLKGIQRSTGMSVTTSLNKNLTVQSEKKVQSVIAPPAEKDDLLENIDDPWLDSSAGYFDSQDYSPLLMQESVFSYDVPSELADETNTFERLGEHNYTAKFDLEDSNDGSSTGICLHIAQNRVSLEFCSDCNQRATDTWNQVEEGQEDNEEDDVMVD